MCFLLVAIATESHGFLLMQSLWLPGVWLPSGIHIGRLQGDISPLWPRCAPTWKIKIQPLCSVVVFFRSFVPFLLFLLLSETMCAAWKMLRKALWYNTIPFVLPRCVFAALCYVGVGGDGCVCVCVLYAIPKRKYLAFYLADAFIQVNAQNSTTYTIILSIHTRRF